MPTDTLPSSVQGTNQSTVLTSWPPLPLRIHINNQPPGDFLIVTSINEPHSEPEEDIAKTLRILGMNITFFEKPLSDPISFNHDILHGLDLELQPSRADQPISKRLFVRVLARVSYLFDQYGAMWLNSEIEQDGGIVGIFNLIF